MSDDWSCAMLMLNSNTSSSAMMQRLLNHHAALAKGNAQRPDIVKGSILKRCIQSADTTACTSNCFHLRKTQ